VLGRFAANEALDLSCVAVDGAPALLHVTSKRDR